MVYTLSLVILKVNWNLHPGGEVGAIDVRTHHVSSKGGVEEGKVDPTNLPRRRTLTVWVVDVPRPLLTSTVVPGCLYDRRSPRYVNRSQRTSDRGGRYPGISEKRGLVP